VHKVAATNSSTRKPRRRAAAKRAVAPAPAFRHAELMDLLQLRALVNGYAAEKLMLPRSADQIALELANYVVTTDAGGRVLACAAICEYSPSLAEIVSVAVLPSERGNGLGSAAVRAAEDRARRRGFAHVFAMSLADRFFLSLGYECTPIDDYPEKIARYEQIVASGVEVVAKRCFRRALG
jgi:N-acetylglutamate synthase-like GNAT family acetyltransferase